MFENILASVISGLILKAIESIVKKISSLHMKKDRPEESANLKDEESFME